jgi:hypothetical protein
VPVHVDAQRRLSELGILIVDTDAESSHARARQYAKNFAERINLAACELERFTQQVGRRGREP